MTNARLRRLIADFQRGRRPALARAITMVEGARPGVADLLGELLLVEPRARRIGITGPPGAGKSSLATLLAKLLRGRDEDVAIVAVDPTSPFSGGALLGDRIRMNELAVDPGIFIRSMATRGSLGGLAAATREVIDLLDAFGFTNVIVETVGVGQTQLEIQAAADTTVVVLVPESGDGIQAMKAGLMEIADVFAVNKADRIGADRMVREIGQALMLRAGLTSGGAGHHGVHHGVHAGHHGVHHGVHAGHHGVHHGVDAGHHGVDLSRLAGTEARSTPPTQDAPPTHSAPPASGAAPASGAPRNPAASWEIPVLKTSAGRNQGVDELLAAILDHGRHLARSGSLDERRVQRARGRIRDAVERDLLRRADRALESAPRLDGWARDVAAGRATAYGVAEKVLDAIFKEARREVGRKGSRGGRSGGGSR